MRHAQTGRRADGQCLIALAVAVAVRLSVCPPVRLAAQDLPAVRTAVVLAAAGRADSARALLDGELARAATGSPAWVEALYFRARLARDGDHPERDLRRIVVEHGNSPWADDALLLLAQNAMAAGNPAGALEYAGRLRTDYPGSELRSHAAMWGGRAAFDAGEPRIACALLDSSLAEAGADVEQANQVVFHRSRCSGLTAGAPAAAAPAPAPAPAPATAPGGFEVQVAASRSLEDAQRIARRFEAAGHATRLVRGEDGLTRVRLGPYPTRDEADAAVRAARDIGGGSPFVVRPS